jgi:superfamily II DNA or RNA helicase
MAFRLNKRIKSSVASPEELFRDLRNNRKVEGLLSQQADMLRKYMEYVDESDVALQMPTGSGKTLVGLLIAEWRRRAKQERVVYLLSYETTR